MIPFSALLWVGQAIVMVFFHLLGIKKYEEHCDADFSMKKWSLPGGIFRFVWSADDGFAFTSVDIRTRKLLNPDGDDSLEHNPSLFFSVMTPDGAKMVRRRLLESIITGRKCQVEFTLKAKSPSAVRLRLDAIPSNGSQRESEWVAMLTDITTQHIIKEELQTAEKKLETISSQERVGAFACDFLAGTAKWDSSLYSLLDLDPAEHQQNYRCWRERVEANDLKVLLAEMARTSKHGGTFEERLQVHHRNQSVHWMHALGTPLFDSIKNRAVLIGIVYDVTARETAKRESIHAQEAVRNDVKATAMMLAVLSHEIRAPLYGITGLLECFKEAELTDEQCQILTDAMTSARSLMVIINHILDFCKLEIGKVELERLAFKPSMCLEAVVDLLHAETYQKQIEFKIENHFDKFACGDSTRFCQLLVHVLSLAIDGCSNCAIRVAMHEVYQIEGDNDKIFILVEVEAEGTSLPLAHISSQDQRAWLKVRHQRSLQMTIYHQLIRLFGGRSGTSNTAATAYWFEIPFTVAYERPESYDFQLSRSVFNLVAATATSPAALHEVYENLAGVRVLIAEDSQINQKLLRHQLQHEGCITDSAYDGSQAVALAKENNYDIVLMDINMPVLDGIGATKEIRNLSEAWAKTPIIGLTAEPISQCDTVYHHAGFSSVLMKPLSKNELVAEIHHALTLKDIT